MNLFEKLMKAQTQLALDQNRVRQEERQKTTAAAATTTTRRPRTTPPTPAPVRSSTPRPPPPPSRDDRIILRTAQTLKQMTATLRGLTATVRGLNRTILEATSAVRQEVPPGMLHMMQSEIAKLTDTVTELRAKERREDPGVTKI